MEKTRLERLACWLECAKQKEADSRSERICVEEEIAALVETKENGQKTVKAGEYSVTVKRGLSYTADVEELLKMDKNPAFPPPIKVKTTRELDLEGYEWYRANHPHLFNLLATHVTVKPKKVSVSVKRAKAEGGE